jgi:hypothetical protein
MKYKYIAYDMSRQFVNDIRLVITDMFENIKMDSISVSFVHILYLQQRIAAMAYILSLHR